MVTQRGEDGDGGWGEDGGWGAEVVTENRGHCRFLTCQSNGLKVPYLFEQSSKI